MAAVLGAIFLVAAATLLVVWLGTPALVKRAIAVSGDAAASLADPTASEERKAALARAHSLALFRIFFRTTLILAVALAVPLAALWPLDRERLVSLPAVLAVTTSIPFIAACAGAGMAAALLWSLARRGGPRPGS
jgi:hypothetical protein